MAVESVENSFDIIFNLLRIKKKNKYLSMDLREGPDGRVWQCLDVTRTWDRAAWGWGLRGSELLPRERSHSCCTTFLDSTATFGKRKYCDEQTSVSTLGSVLHLLRDVELSEVECFYSTYYPINYPIKYHQSVSFSSSIQHWSQHTLLWDVLEDQRTLRTTVLPLDVGLPGRCDMHPPTSVLPSSSMGNGNIGSSSGDMVQTVDRGLSFPC